MELIKMAKKQTDSFEVAELNGIIRTIRNPLNKKILQEVCIGKKKYRKNNVYGTYNSTDNNDLLRYKDSRKIRTCK